MYIIWNEKWVFTVFMYYSVVGRRASFIVALKARVLRIYGWHKRAPLLSTWNDWRDRYRRWSRHFVVILRTGNNFLGSMPYAVLFVRRRIPFFFFFCRDLRANFYVAHIPHTRSFRLVLNLAKFLRKTTEFSYRWIFFPYRAHLDNEPRAINCVRAIKWNMRV